jgi:hypothetical protein
MNNVTANTDDSTSLSSQIDIPSLSTRITAKYLESNIAFLSVCCVGWQAIE